MCYLCNSYAVFRACATFVVGHWNSNDFKVRQTFWPKLWRAWCILYRSSTEARAPPIRQYKMHQALQTFSQRFWHSLWSFQPHYPNRKVITILCEEYRVNAILVSHHRLILNTTQRLLMQNVWRASRVGSQWSACHFVLHKHFVWLQTTAQNGTERNGTERDGTERNNLERNGTERKETHQLQRVPEFVTLGFDLK